MSSFRVSRLCTLPKHWMKNGHYMMPCLCMRFVFCGKPCMRRGHLRKVQTATSYVSGDLNDFVSPLGWRGPNSACDVGLPLELTSGLGRDRGESGGLRGVLVAPARHRVKLGCLSMGIVGSGHMLARSREFRWRGKLGGHQGN